MWKKLKSELEDVATLHELAKEAHDQETYDEVQENLRQLSESIRKMEFARMMSGELDRNSCFLQVNAGAGGTESMDWTSMLLRMYLHWSEKHSYRTELIDEVVGEEAGIKSATIRVMGDFAYGYLKAEIGVHRLVRISPFDSNARRHTSFASVFVYPEVDDEINIEIDEEDVRVDTFRASGAGGQHVNKTDSAIRMTHIPTGIVVQCQNERSQHKNRSMAMKMLKARLYEREVAERQKERDEVEANKMAINFGSQIRSYVLQPYQLAKDLRTDVETGNVDAVLDGEIDPFIEAYLLSQAKKDTGTKNTVN